MAQEKKTPPPSYWEESLAVKHLPESKVPAPPKEETPVEQVPVATPPPIMEPLKEETSTSLAQPPAPPAPVVPRQPTRLKPLLKKLILPVGGVLLVLTIGVSTWQIVVRNKKTNESVVISTVPPTEEALEPFIPGRISSAFVPLPPSSTPADQTINWQSYQVESPSFTVKYPKEWQLKKIQNSEAFLRFSYPNTGEAVTSFSRGERSYILFSKIKKENTDLDAQVAKGYVFQKKEKLDIGGISALRVYNVSGGANVFLFLPLGGEVLLVEHQVRVPEEFSSYSDLFLLMDKSIKIL